MESVPRKLSSENGPPTVVTLMLSESDHSQSLSWVAKTCAMTIAAVGTIGDQRDRRLRIPVSEAVKLSEPMPAVITPPK
jgi:hypothetical protein